VHGEDGRGSWRAALFLVRPGKLNDAAAIDRRSDQYLFDIIKYGGAPIGRPGMPAFGATLTDSEIAELVGYVRGFSRALTQEFDSDQTSLSSRWRTASFTRSPDRPTGSRSA
jgi:hypothetical protein